jgi:hypothetical protein
MIYSADKETEYKYNESAFNTSSHIRETAL